MDEPAAAALTAPDPPSPVGARARLAPAPGSEQWAAVRDPAVVLCTVAVSLTVAEFWARRDGSGIVPAGSQFGRLCAWAVVTVLAYVVPPVLVTRFVLRRPLRRLGLRVRGIRSHAPVYLGLLAVALPAVVVASSGDGFREKYPFYDLAPGESFWPNLWIWWALYCAQFVALEFFFRGFMVHALAPSLGAASVFVMVVPYNMIHYGKPMPEALAAIVGGVVLGTLSYRTRSIWLGAGVHVAIAITMDLCALWHADRLF
jgi:membrane protease YdiL (CAAX protease family)